MAVKEIGLNCVLAFSTAGTTVSLTTLASVRSIGGPTANGTAIDVSTLDDADHFRRFRGGRVDPGEVSVGVIYDPADATHQQMAQLLNSRVEAQWQVTFNTTTNKEKFKGFVNELSLEIPLDDAVTRDMVIKVTGDPGFTT